MNILYSVSILMLAIASFSQIAIIYRLQKKVFRLDAEFMAMQVHLLDQRLMALIPKAKERV